MGQTNEWWGKISNQKFIHEHFQEKYYRVLQEGIVEAKRPQFCYELFRISTWANLEPKEGLQIVFIKDGKEIAHFHSGQILALTEEIKKAKREFSKRTTKKPPRGGK